MRREKDLIIERDKYKVISEEQSKIASDAETLLSKNLSEVMKSRFGAIGLLKETVDRAGNMSANKANDLIASHTRKLVEQYFDGDKVSRKFEVILNESYDNVISSFRADYPDLKMDDYNFFCCVVAGFDAKTILRVCPMRTADSVYTRKNRMKEMIESSTSERKSKYLSFFSKKRKSPGNNLIFCPHRFF